MEEHPDNAHYSPMRWRYFPQTAPNGSRWFILQISGMPTGPMFFWFDEASIRTKVKQLQEMLSGIVVPRMDGGVVPPSAEIVDWEKVREEKNK